VYCVYQVRGVCGRGEGGCVGQGKECVGEV